ncbi:MAG: SLBB domain-containing protein [Synergistaceae bacterium]|nr:SLBB domain-containing protein [Synergistaceae bacterium]
MKMTCKKIFIALLMQLALCNAGYAAVMNAQTGQQPAGVNTNNNNVQRQPQNYYQGNINRPLVEDTRPNMMTYDYYDYEPFTSDDIPLTDEEINELFDQILNSQNDNPPKDPTVAKDTSTQRRMKQLQRMQQLQNKTGNNNQNQNQIILPDYEEEEKEKPFKSPINQLFKRIPRYGMSFFRHSPASFVPLDSVPVTQDYRIGVGDEMTLTIWGIPEEGFYNFIINRDGMASLPHIGTIRLAGYTMQEAERVIHTRLNRYYTGFQMNLSMGKVSSIMVYVTGNARRPGAYTVSSFSTLVNALLASGGPASNGSLRKIELKRGAKTVAVFDMYAMLMRGDKTQDARLQAGDVIYIPPVGPLVGVAGEVQKPGIYEINGTTRMEDLLYIIGGMSARTFAGRIQYFRIMNNSYVSAFEGSLSELENSELHDGDIIRLFPISNLSATARIEGTLLKPGTYAITPGRTTIADLIKRAGGLKPTASDTAEITRVTPSLEGPVNERFTVNIAQALQGDPMNNLTLEDNDQITVLVIPEWKKQISVTIAGEVKKPGVYAMFPGERLSDLLTRAGGFTSKAFLRGAIFTRPSVAEEQKRALNRMADQMERDLLQSMQNTSSTSGSTALDAEYQRRIDLIDSLRELDIMGRIVTKIDSPQNIIGTAWDYELQDGDVLRIPDTPLTVNIMGAVYSSTSYIYNPSMGINAYIGAAGGALKNAHKRLVYLLKSDGTTVRLTRSTSMLSSKMWKAPRGYSAKIEPGDTIVVPVKYLERQNIDNLKDTIDIIYKVAVGVGVILNNTK